MAADKMIFLPENVVADLAGKPLPGDGVYIEFEYNGHRYRARQRDPGNREAEVQCELVEPVVQKKPPLKKGPVKSRGGHGRRIPR